MDNLVFASIQELAEAIHQRQVSSVEVVEAHLAQIDRHNPRLNVIVLLDREAALNRAREADAALAHGEVWGSLHGVPITIKDGFATAGLRTTSGFPPWVDFVPETDAPVVARLRAAGAIILGKTNLPTLSMDAQANNPIFGRTNNPWDLSRTSGGSTGGAAAVAAGLSPLELGSDLAGSVRIPAHCCGVYGLKPTADRIPSGGYHPNPKPAPPQTAGPTFGVFGPLARSVDDLALAFQVMAGPHSHSWKVPSVPVGQIPDLRLPQLRLAWTDSFGHIPVDNDTRIALTRLAENLALQGTYVERRLPEPFDFIAAGEMYGALTVAQSGGNPAVAAGFGPDSESDNPTRRGAARGLEMTLNEYLESLRQQSVLIAALEAFFGHWDALLCPVMPMPAFPHCAPGTPILVDGQPVDYWLATIGYTSLFNLTGHPVVVLPVAQSHQGLPIGVQVVGRRWDEMQLLAVAKCITEVAGAFRRPPGY
jgi:amidase